MMGKLLTSYGGKNADVIWRENLPQMGGYIYC